MRLAGIEKGGFYPYPPHMAEATASWFVPLPAGTRGRLLDPCAGACRGVTCHALSRFRSTMSRKYASWSKARRGLSLSGSNLAQRSLSPSKRLSIPLNSAVNSLVSQDFLPLGL